MVLAYSCGLSTIIQLVSSLSQTQRRVPQMPTQKDALSPCKEYGYWQPASLTSSRPLQLLSPSHPTWWLSQAVVQDLAISTPPRTPPMVVMFPCGTDGRWQVCMMVSQLLLSNPTSSSCLLSQVFLTNKRLPSWFLLGVCFWEDQLTLSPSKVSPFRWWVTSSP